MPNHKLMGYCRFKDVLPLLECRKKSELPANPETVIVCLFPFFVGEYPERNVGRYAIVNDYHRVGGDILKNTAAQLKAAFPTEEFVPFIDNSPIREVRAAHLAGLGKIGVHGMLIHEVFGSRVFIGTIVTTLKLKPYEKPAQKCLNCGLCVKACPTNAFSETEPLNRALCRSAITQTKRDLTDWEADQIAAGGMVWGCDLCADVCPLNQNTPTSPIKGFSDNVLPLLTHDNLEAGLALKPYNWRGAKVLRRNLDIIEEKERFCGNS